VNKLIFIMFLLLTVQFQCSLLFSK